MWANSSLSQRKNGRRGGSAHLFLNEGMDDRGSALRFLNEGMDDGGSALRFLKEGMDDGEGSALSSQ